MNPDEFVRYDATGLAALIAGNEVSAREVCDAAIDMIERHNPSINAVTETCFDLALASIDEVADGQLRGVPWVVKDLHTWVGGMRGTNGSKSFRDVVIETDSELVARHRRAGLVILGKTNTPEFGMNVCTNPSLFGPTRHPLDPDRSVGGSSGGSGAVVAAGVLPAAHATDSGGSIRIPASNCGLFGLKPSRNRVPLGNDASEGLAGLSTGHALTNSVRDSALLLDVTHGPMPGDGGGPPPPSSRFIDALNTETGALSVGLLTKGFAGEAVHPDCVAAAEGAAALLEDLGHRVERVEEVVDGQALRNASSDRASRRANRCRLCTCPVVVPPGDRPAVVLFRGPRSVADTNTGASSAVDRLSRPHRRELVHLSRPHARRHRFHAVVQCVRWSRGVVAARDRFHRPADRSATRSEAGGRRTSALGFPTDRARTSLARSRLSQ
jgi:Asp-tRNA(Asn)/Glu-tRNA(Gln) amidotransferase A subunit family amidase